MANRPARVSQIEVKRTVSGAMAAGVRIARIEVDYRTGRVTIIPEGAAAQAAGPDPDELLR